MKKKTEAPVTAQLRLGSAHPFGGLRGYVPLGGGEERIYREVRSAVPVVDAAISKLVRLCGGFRVKCSREEELAEFLRTVPLHGQRFPKQFPPDIRVDLIHSPGQYDLIHNHAPYFHRPKCPIPLYYHSKKTRKKEEGKVGCDAQSSLPGKQNNPCFQIWGVIYSSK